jgi:hypothetical protein
MGIYLLAILLKQALGSTLHSALSSTVEIRRVIGGQYSTSPKGQRVSIRQYL